MMGEGKIAGNDDTAIIDFLTRPVWLTGRAFGKDDSSKIVRLFGARLLKEILINKNKVERLRFLGLEYPTGLTV